VWRVSRLVGSNPVSVFVQSRDILAGASQRLVVVRIEVVCYLGVHGIHGLVEHLPRLPNHPAGVSCYLGQLLRTKDDQGQNQDDEELR
jgi:hypothetical protein